MSSGNTTRPSDGKPLPGVRFRRGSHRIRKHVGKQDKCSLKQVGREHGSQQYLVAQQELG